MLTLLLRNLCRAIISCRRPAIAGRTGAKNTIAGASAGDF